MTNLSSLDHAFLSVLRMDGRAPIAELARDLGVTRTMITRHIDVLTDVGVIFDFTVRMTERVDTAVRTISRLTIESSYAEETIEIL